VILIIIIVLATAMFIVLSW